MLKRIDIEDVRLGMFIHKMEGSWLSHPFWRSKFLLEDPDTLGELRDSDLKGLIIDVSRGCDVAAATQVDAPAALGFPPERRRRIARPAPAGFDPLSTARTPLSREFGQARQVAQRSEKAISRVFFDARLGKAVDGDAVEPVVSEIFASIQRNPQAFNGLMRCKRDRQFVFQHSLAVSALMISLARAMAMPVSEVREAGMVGLLLHVGMGRLNVDLEATQGDWRGIDPSLLKDHPQLGYDCLILGGDIPQRVTEAVLHHHERMDGHGYPAGLAGNAIPVLARMAAICSNYDELVSDHPDRRGCDPATAIAAMSEDVTGFDPVILECFIEATGAYPIGSIVRLASERLAMVVDQDPNDHRLPIVRAFWSLRDCSPIRAENIALANCMGRDRIVGSADPEQHGLAEFPAWREKIYETAVKSST